MLSVFVVMNTLDKNLLMDFVWICGVMLISTHEDYM